MTWLQLRELGFSRAAVSRWVVLGRLFRVHRGVYAVGRRELSRDGMFHAAVLTVGDGAALSEFACAAHWGFWKGRTNPIDVTVARKVQAQPGIRVHCVRELPDYAVTTHLGIRVTTVERAILDLAATMYSDRYFRRLVHEAEAQGLTNPDRLNAEIDRARPRTPGLNRLRNEIADGPKPTRSGLEDDLLDLLRRHDFPPFETNAHVPGTPVWVNVDALFERHMLVIEVDGDRWHNTKYRRHIDARKQAIIEAVGYRVMRLLEEDLKPTLESQTVARIRHALP